MKSFRNNNNNKKATPQIKIRKEGIRKKVGKSNLETKKQSNK